MNKIPFGIRLLIGRILGLVPVIAGLAAISFAVLALVPGDPALALAGPDADPATISILRARYGLDRPLPQRFVIWAGYAVTGDLGRSIQTGRPVAAMIQEALGPTLLLALAALLLSLAVALPLGVGAAARRGGGLLDTLAALLAVAGLSLPTFWLGTLLVLGFAVHLGWLPASGPGETPAEALRHLVLPALTLGTGLAASTLRMTRAALLDVLPAHFVRTARAKGLAPGAVLSRHAMRPALLPIITLLGVQAGQLAGGMVVTETLFAWPGIGKLLVDAIFVRDYPVVMGALIVTASLSVLANTAADVAAVSLDPRLRTQRGGP
jgi:peptide/nickel transport system permease protein